EECAARFVRKPTLEFDQGSVSSGHAAASCGGNQPHASETWDNGISLAFMAAVFSFLDFLIVDSMLDTVGRHGLDFESPMFLYAHKNAFTIWTDVLTLRIRGYQSGFGHKFVIFGTLTFLIVYSSCLFLFPVVSIVYASIIVLSNASWPLGFFDCIVIFSIFVILTISVISLTILFRGFKFSVPTVAMQQSHGPVDRQE
ncbi:MAG TPA: hypothetical protein VM325_07660, partial [Alphaproteobacteria bacterium]|nr:hypothetical protein [Alphaproteobacteria bacterium]